MQVYKGLPLLTAQPDAKDRAEIPHLLYEVLEPYEASSAGKWAAMAGAAVNDVWADGKTPVLVGGTGMYFASLFGGLADIPPIPDDVRQKVVSLYEELGEKRFREKLAAMDSASAARIASNDRQRLIRAYEVVAHTGKTLGEWQSVGSAKGVIILAEDRHNVEKHLLLPDRAKLYAACDLRFSQMMENGAIDEVKSLTERNLDSELPAMKVIGVREIAAYLRGEIDLESAVKKAQQATRNYAKRQMTWFRNTGFGLGKGQYGKESVNENPR